MKIWLSARLLWDSSQDTEKLLRGFFADYFGPAAPQMRYYFDLVQARWDYIEREYHLYLKSVHYLDDREFWSADYLNDCLSAIEEARGKAQAVTDEKTRETLMRRILIESMSPRYMKLNLYAETYGAELEQVKDAFLADCKTLGITCFGCGNRQVLIREDVLAGRREYFDEDGNIVG